MAQWFDGRERALVVLVAAVHGLVPWSQQGTSGTMSHDLSVHTRNLLTSGKRAALGNQTQHLELGRDLGKP